MNNNDKVLAEIEELIERMLKFRKRKNLLGSEFSEIIRLAEYDILDYINDKIQEYKEKYPARKEKNKNG